MQRLWRTCPRGGPPVHCPAAARSAAFNTRSEAGNEAAALPQIVHFATFYAAFRVQAPEEGVRQKTWGPLDSVFLVNI